MKNSNVEKGAQFEIAVYKLISKLLSTGDFLYSPKQARIERQKEYYSKDRKKNIKVDISIEVYLNGETEYSALCIIECKNYSKKVSIDNLEEFKGKLDQIAGKNVKGIMITSSSFPQSAIEYSGSHGIGLARFISKDQIKWDVKRSQFSPNADLILSVGRKVEPIRYLIDDEIQSENPIHCYGNDCVIPEFSRLIYQFIGFGNMHPISNNYLISMAYGAENKNWEIEYLSVERIEAIVNELYNDLGKKYLKGNAETRIEKLIEYVKSRFSAKIELVNSIDSNSPNIIILGKTRLNPCEIHIVAEDGELKERALFTFAHEIGHLILHYGIFGDSECAEIIDNDDTVFKSEYISEKMLRRIEVQANLFAESLLLPKEIFVHDVVQSVKRRGITYRGRGLMYLDDQPCNQSSYESIVMELKGKYLVSKEAIEYRLKRLSLLVDERKKPRKISLAEILWSN